MRFDLRKGFDNHAGLDEDVKVPEFKFSADVQQPAGDPHRCRCELSVELLDDPADKFPYTFGVSLVGIFRINEMYPSDQIEMLVRVNAPSILYSAARELVMSFTGRGGYPPCLLPSISFAPPFGNEVKTRQTRVEEAPSTSARKRSPTRKSAAKSSRKTAKK